jgi:hypothetical protein
MSDIVPLSSLFANCGAAGPFFAVRGVTFVTFGEIEVGEILHRKAELY